MSYGSYVTCQCQMASDISDTRASGMLKEVEEDLNRKLRVGTIFIIAFMAGHTSLWMIF